MIIKGLNECDFVNYKKASMFISYPYCSFKCQKECGEHCCQNSALTQAPNIEISTEKLVDKYLSNPITSAVVCGGFEPMDSFEDVYNLISCLRSKECLDDVVIFSGYYPNEIQDKIDKLKQFKNIIIKFGRYHPNDTSHYDPILGVQRASLNQYAERIS